MFLLLASNSPRRRRLLALGGWDFAVQAADVDESLRPGEPPVEYVLRLAKEKALAVAQYAQASVVVAADTTVVDGADILGKPLDADDAARMLRRLRGGVHQVYTGLAVYLRSGERLLSDWCVTDVPMRLYSDAEMEAYIAGGDPLDKAGAYAIQHPEFRPVENLQGCYANVVGLPLCHLARMLIKIGLPPHGDLPAACQAELQYSCPVYRQILQSA